MVLEIQAINHGMEDSFLDKVCEISKQSFALLLKRSYNMVNQMEGYGNDKVLTDKQRLDLSDRLYLHVFPEDIRKLQLWPQKPDCFRYILRFYSEMTELDTHRANKILLGGRDVFEEYMKNMKLLSESLLKAMNCFLDQCGERGTTIARFNFYPPCPRPDFVLRVKQHADASAITILLQDKEVEGLQVLKDDQWFRVPVVPYGLLIKCWRSS
nr:protein SRG1-like [Solanum lycopersicum]